MKRFTVHRQPGIKTVRLNLFTVNNERRIQQVIHSGPGKLFTAEHVQKLIDLAIERIDENLPGHEYAIVRVSPGVFNFVWKSGPVPAQTTTTA